MKKEDLFIGQKIYSLDTSTPDFLIVESEICGLRVRETRDGEELEVYISGTKYNGTTLYFENGKLSGNHFFFSEDEVKEKYKKKLVEKLNELESYLKELRLKNWELLCK